MKTSEFLTIALLFGVAAAVAIWQLRTDPERQKRYLRDLREAGL